MSDNVSITPGTGATVAAKDLGGGVLAQRTVSVVGTADVSSTNPVPVVDTALAPGAATDAKVEAVRSLLAGTLAVSASALPLPSGAATAGKQDAGNTTLASILAGLGAVILAAGTAVIGRVGLQIGGADVAAANPVPTTNPEARSFQGIAASTIGPFPVTTASANAAIALPASGGQVRIAVTGSSPVRVAWGTSNAAAATTPTPGTLASGSYSGGTAGSKLVGNGVEILSAPAGTTYVAFKTDGGTSTVEFTPGAGA